MKEPKKFNIVEAISGKPVQTRDGQLVTQLHEFKDVAFKNSLFGVMNSAVHAWKLNGSYISEDRLHNLDLFMTEEVSSKNAIGFANWLCYNLYVSTINGQKWFIDNGYIEHDNREFYTSEELYTLYLETL